MLQRTLEPLHRLLASAPIPKDKSTRRFRQVRPAVGDEFQGQLFRHHCIVGQAKRRGEISGWRRFENS
jgi:hypothetical protein